MSLFLVEQKFFLIKYKKGLGKFKHMSLHILYDKEVTTWKACVFLSRKVET